MPTPEQIRQAIEQVKGQESFINILLRQTLEWEIPEGVGDVEEIAYGWSAEDLRAKGLDEKIIDGQIWQIQPLNPEVGKQWGIFVLEFKNEDAFVMGRGLIGPLREVLRGLVPKRRSTRANLPTWEPENLLFICTFEYKHFRFAYFKAPKGKEKTAPLSLFGWNHGDRDVRTLCVHNLPYLRWDPEALDLEQWREAFSIEKVTRDFYREYAEAFEAVENIIGKENVLAGNDLRLYTQMLFNRLMFLRFIEKKGWLRFNNSTDYLAALYAAGGKNGQSFYRSRLCPLFFEALAIEGEQQSEAVGEVVFLNGGLFEKVDLDDKVEDIPDVAFKSILSQDGLFYHFNFTVEESTPFDIEVAVDPEMLGKVFEELVTGRHESGSYYTPRPVVSFMCKEALKAFLIEKTSATKEALATLVDEHDIARELSESHAEEILYYLDTIKACDPACGSGAYLLGLLQELVTIRRCLQNERLQADPSFLYKLKLGIISRSLYGVDIDEFATNVAKLRLWLSLAVESEQAEPLPNLDFKIETGDSVLGPCTPYLESSEALMMEALRQRANELVVRKDRFMLAHGDEKRSLYQEIKSEEQAIAEETATAYGEGVIAWHIHFAEVFISSRRQREINSFLADVGTFEVTTFEPGGFDIVLANPPYIRQELIKKHKPRLKEIFPETFTSTADLYTYFYTRAVEMLAPGGVLSFISSNKWFRAAYGKKLRRYIAKNCCIHSITDFGELPVFKTAATFPMICVAQKSTKKISTLFTQVKSLNPPYPDVKAITEESGSELPDDAINGDDWILSARATLTMLRKMEASGMPLKEYVNGEIYYGIKTGFNRAFVIDENTRQDLIRSDPASEDLIKPMAKGDDIRKWSVRQKNRWLIVTPIGVDINRYPAIFQHLNNWERDLKRRSDQGNHWWELRACTYYHIFEGTKIHYPEIAKEPRFALDNTGIYPLKTAFTIPTSDLFLLGVLNSKPAWEYLKNVCSVLGDAEQGGRLTLQTIFVENLPVPNTTSETRRTVENLVKKCLKARGNNCEEWEAEIDIIMARLYGVEI